MGTTGFEAEAPERARLAQQIVKDVFGLKKGFNVGKKEIAAVGIENEKLIFRGTSSDEVIEENMKKHLQNLWMTSPHEAFKLEALLALPEQQVLFFGAARWAEQGLPVIRLGHKRAAAYMATQISEEGAKHVRPPFKAFFIEVPDGLLSVRFPDEDGTLQDYRVEGVFVHVVRAEQDPDGKRIFRDYEIGKPIDDTYRWRYALITGKHVVQWELNRETHEVAGHHVREGDAWEGVGLPADDYDKRLSLLVGRLICATCLMMSNPDRPESKSEPVVKSKSGKHAATGTPFYHVFALTAPIENDAREVLRAYVRGERDAPVLRHWVSPHWKHQPYGPGRLLRKHIYIEGYHRGVLLEELERKTAVTETA